MPIINRDAVYVDLLNELSEISLRFPAEFERLWQRVNNGEIERVYDVFILSIYELLKLDFNNQKQLNNFVAVGVAVMDYARILDDIIDENLETIYKVISLKVLRELAKIIEIKGESLFSESFILTSFLDEMLFNFLGVPDQVFSLSGYIMDANKRASPSRLFESMRAYDYLSKEDKCIINSYVSLVNAMSQLRDDMYDLDFDASNLSSYIFRTQCENGSLNVLQRIDYAKDILKNIISKELVSSYHGLMPSVVRYKYAPYLLSSMIVGIRTEVDD